MRLIKILSIASLLTLGLGVNSSTYASVAVIVHPDNANQLTAKQLRNIYLGKLRAFPDGVEVETFDLAPGLEVRDEFVKKVLKKTEANLNSYWARMLFSSKGKPPEEMAAAADVIKAVSSNKSAIGYISEDDVTDNVKVLMVIP